MGLLKLAFDRQRKALVSYDGSATTIPPLYQRNTQDIRITVVDSSNGSPFRPVYTPVDLSAVGLRLVIVASVTGEADTVLAATHEAGWAWDGVNNCFNGQVDLNTAEVDSFIGSASSKAAVLEVNIVTAGVYETVFGSPDGRTNVTLSAIADDASAAAPASLGTPPTIGRLALDHGVDGVSIASNIVTVTGLGLGFTPSYFLLWIEAPSGSGFMGVNFVVGSGSSAGFDAVINAVPDDIADYKLVYIPVE